MTTAEHDEDQHAFTRRMPGATKGEVVVRDASADAHVAEGRNDVKKNVEGRSAIAKRTCSEWTRRMVEGKCIILERAARSIGAASAGADDHLISYAHPSIRYVYLQPEALHGFLTQSTARMPPTEGLRAKIHPNAKQPNRKEKEIAKRNDEE